MCCMLYKNEIFKFLKMVEKALVEIFNLNFIEDSTQLKRFFNFRYFQNSRNVEWRFKNKVYPNKAFIKTGTAKKRIVRKNCHNNNYKKSIES